MQQKKKQFTISSERVNKLTLRGYKSDNLAPEVVCCDWRVKLHDEQIKQAITFSSNPNL